MADSIKVLVVDDSAFMRKVISDMLESDPDIKVIDTASNGEIAIAKAVKLRPDVITLDVEMPRLDGLDALQAIMEQAPCPVLMVSSLTQRGAASTIKALALGAIDFIPKPSGSVSLNMQKVCADLIAKVKMAAGTRVKRSASIVKPPKFGLQPTYSGFSGWNIRWLTIIAASTGGPGALHQLLGCLPKNLRSSLLIIQHMPANFTTALAEHLDRDVQISVREAATGDQLKEGLALLAPGGYHMSITDAANVMIKYGPPRHGVRPAADVTLESLPKAMLKRSIVIILTGMGADGAAGAKQVRAQGAQVWVQDEESCVVFGMPQAALSAADRIGTPEQLGSWLTQHVGTS